MEEDLTTPADAGGLSRRSFLDQEEDGLLAQTSQYPWRSRIAASVWVHLLELPAAEAAPLIGECLEHVLRAAAQRPLALLEEVRPEPAEQVGKDAGVIHRALRVLQPVRADLP